MKKKSLLTPNGTGKTLLKMVTVVMVAIGLVSGLSTAAATSDITRNQLKRMYDRLIGVPPTEADLASMVTELTDNGDVAAALWAINNGSRKKEFYNTTLKNFFVKYTNIDDSPLPPLNDAAATMIGLVKDSGTRGFDEVLYGDILYTAPNAGVTAYSRENNKHYEELEDRRIDLSTLTRRSQSGGPVQKAPESSANPVAAGVLTTRAWGEAYFSEGTNRRVFASVMSKFMCRELEELKDNTRVPDRIRQDVSRSPGGDSSIFLNHCIACHAGMDPLVAAFAYYDWVVTDETTDPPIAGLVYNDKIIHTPNAITPIKHKYLINAGSFPQGYVTVNDSWENYWREGKNAALGWGLVTLSNSTAPGGPPPPVQPSGSTVTGTTNTGAGPQSFGEEIASSTAFGECQVNRVYRHVCLQEPTSEHKPGLEAIRDTSFSKGNFNMKEVFAKTAALCKGQ